VDLAPAVSQIISEIPDVQAVYVFGSVATGEELPGSDVDVAFLAPRKLDPVERFRLQERIAALVGRSVDLVDLQAASTVMRVEVLRNGEVLYDAHPGVRAMFEARALSEYASLNESRAGILADIKARGSVHG
jgi:predicted nucleotidyltransferase